MSEDLAFRGVGCGFEEAERAGNLPEWQIKAGHEWLAKKEKHDAVAPQWLAWLQQNPMTKRKPPKSYLALYQDIERTPGEYSPDEEWR